jgi:hypothetical protein
MDESDLIQYMHTKPGFYLQCCTDKFAVATKNNRYNVIAVVRMYQRSFNTVINDDGQWSRICQCLLLCCTQIKGAQQAHDQFRSSSDDDMLPLCKVALGGMLCRLALISDMIRHGAKKDVEGKNIIELLECKNTSAISADCTERRR